MGIEGAEHNKIQLDLQLPGQILHHPMKNMWSKEASVFHVIGNWDTFPSGVVGKLNQ